MHNINRAGGPYKTHCSLFWPLQSLKSQIQEQAASELKRAQEKVLKVQEDIDNKKKKMEEELAADLEAKEKNRQQLLEETKARLRKRYEAHVSLFFISYCFADKVNSHHSIYPV